MTKTSFSLCVYGNPGRNNGENSQESAGKLQLRLMITIRNIIVLFGDFG
jgi:hypothetical protein